MEIYELFTSKGEASRAADAARLFLGLSSAFNGDDDRCSVKGISSQTHDDYAP